jgi:hypothetical protein
LKVYVDFSIFFEPDGAYGSVSGELELATYPIAGDAISFLFSPETSFDTRCGFDGSLRVTSRQLTALPARHQVFLSLGDVMVKSKADAEALAGYFESTFGLSSFPYQAPE